MTEILQTLSCCRLFSPVDQPGLERLAQATRRCALRERRILFNIGDPSEELYILGSGRVAFRYQDENGRQITLGIAEAGMVVGDMELVDPTPRKSRAIVLLAGTAVIVPRQDFMDCCHAYPAILEKLLRIYSRRLQYCTRMMLLKNEEKLLASVLCTYARRFGSDSPQGRKIDLLLSQEELASHVGVSRQCMNRMIGDFRDRGLISTRYSTITIRDNNALRVLSERE